MEMAGGVELVEELGQVGERRVAIEREGELLVFRPGVLEIDLLTDMRSFRQREEPLLIEQWGDGWIGVGG